MKPLKHVNYSPYV